MLKFIFANSEINFSYTDKIKATVAPDRPGITKASPINIPLIKFDKNFFKFYFLSDCK